MSALTPAASTGPAFIRHRRALTTLPVRLSTVSSHRRLFVCCCVLTLVLIFLVIFDLMNPSVGFFRG